ncbi:molybdenum cofactor sulfurase [Homalodisca vitripennis]|uniref:molybdenum cofactor sulfurase n=1 Tax=Homalodisca vitripennis TaxID=197043 RepID=UPI001EEBD4B7|nr:molybdenum cofactor sulfurase [Homalodisca vitripennis]
MHFEQPLDLLTPEVFNQDFGYVEGTYLDHAGAALYPRSLVEAISNDLCTNLYMNPHSNPDSGGEFVYLHENHTSVLGMRNVDNVLKNIIPVRNVTREYVFNTIAERHRQQREYALQIMQRNVGQQEVRQEIGHLRHINRGNSLFAYPAQCNFSGYKYPMNWVNEVQMGVLERKPENPSRWFCLLDAAAFVSTSELNLGVVQPDFVCISFYKMFGLPTGLGALLVRNTSAHVLQKQYFGGGTVRIAMASPPTQFLKTVLHERFEDGTAHFHGIVAVGHALNWLESSGLDMIMISDHCHRLIRYLFHALREIRYYNLRPAVLIYADSNYEDPSIQGPIINFNLLDENGSILGYNTMMNIAEAEGIYLRVGCFCNPGACQRHLEISDYQYMGFFVEAGHECGDDIDKVGVMPTGSIRVSVGLYTRRMHIDTLIYAIQRFVLSRTPRIYAHPDAVVNIIRGNRPGRV